jgi:hypothetical protein
MLSGGGAACTGRLRMAPGSEAAHDEATLAPAAVAVVGGALLVLFAIDPAVGSVGALGAVAILAYLGRMWWLAACAAAWALVFLAVLTIPGPYDSWAGRAVIPVLAGYALCFLGGWALGRRAAGRRLAGQWEVRTVGGRPQLAWPSEFRLRGYLLALLFVAVASAVLQYRGLVPPLLSDNPDAAREALGQRANITTGLMSQAWTLGLAVSLLRALTGGRHGRPLYVAFALAFAFGAALGASRNFVLVGIVPALIAALSVQRRRRRARHRAGPLARGPARNWVVVIVGLTAVAAAVVLSGQRTLAGTGLFEDEFRARYGGNPVVASVASLDLSLSSSAETFGRLWAQRERFEPRNGAYSLKFLGSRGEPVVGTTDLYGITSQLSSPYYMNTATFVAIPLLDFGPVGAALFLLALGLCVGLGERLLESSSGPAQQLGRAFIVYYAAFGVYELYPFIQPFWLSLVPGLVALHVLARASR